MFKSSLTFQIIFGRADVLQEHQQRGPSGYTPPIISFADWCWVIGWQAKVAHSPNYIEAGVPVKPVSVMRPYIDLRCHAT